MIIDVIPAKKLPRQLSRLSYLVPKKIIPDIKIGQLISVPLRHKIETAVVANVNQTTTTRLKPGILKYIIKINCHKPVFTPMQLQLFAQLSQYYFISESIFICHHLPKINKSEIKTIKPVAINNIPQKTKNQLYYLWLNPKNTSSNYKKIISQSTEQNQILFVVPRISDINILAKKIKINKNQYITIHGNLNRAEKTNAWIKAINTQQKIFIGTRSALFYPYTNLKTIVIDQESSSDHKQYDMNPRYHSRQVAKIMAKINQSDLFLTSFTPAVNSYYCYQPKPPKYKFKPKIINLKNEFTKKNYSFISTELENLIYKTTSERKQIFLFINKKGESSNLTCQDCQYIFTCPSCQLPLIKTKKKQLRCYYCGHKEDIPPFCPKCSGAKFKSSGLGIEKIESNINQIFPKTKTIHINKPDSKTARKNKKKPQSEIILGTEFALDKINWKKIGLIGIMNADQLWQHSEYNSAENAYKLILKILTKTHKNANIIIQTFNPEHYIIKALQQNKPQLFYERELKYRQQYDYPPFKNIIKISLLNSNLNTVRLKSDQLYQKIKQFNSKKLKINPPLIILRRKIREKYKFNIIIKTNQLSDFEPIVKHIPTECIIDINPEKLLD